jgi:hypothetical protein
MQVRAATRSDADAVRRVQEESWRAAYAHVFPAEHLAADFVDADYWRRTIDVPPPGWTLLVAGDPVVGFACVGPSRDEDAVGADRGLERASAPVRLVVRVGGGERQVRHLAGSAVGTLEQLTVHDDAEAHTRSYVQVDEIVDRPTDPAPPLAEGGEVHVVLEHDARRELGPDLVEDALARPSGQVVREQRMPGGPEHAGAPDGGHRDAAPADTGRIGRTPGDGTDRRDQRTRRTGARRLPALGHDLPGEVGDGGPDVFPADVDPDDPAGRRVQLVQERGRTLPAGRSPGLSDEPRSLQRRQRLRDGRLREARLPGDLRPGDGPPVADPIQDRPLVDRPEQAGRARRVGLLCRRDRLLAGTVIDQSGNFPNEPTGC